MFSEPYMNMGDTNYAESQFNQTMKETIHEKDDENENLNEKSI